MCVCMYVQNEKLEAAVGQSVAITAEVVHCCSEPFAAHPVLLSCQAVVSTGGYRADSSLTQGCMLGQHVEHSMNTSDCSREC